MFFSILKKKTEKQKKQKTKKKKTKNKTKHAFVGKYLLPWA